MLVLNPDAGPSRLRTAHLDASHPPAIRSRHRRRRQPRALWALLALPLAAAETSAAPAEATRTHRRRVRPTGVPPFYTFNGDAWEESGDWALNGRYGSEYRPPNDPQMVQDNVPVASSILSTTTSAATASRTPTALKAYTPFSNGKRDRTSFYAVPLIIVLSVILFSCLVIFLFGTLFYWKKKRAYRKRRRAIEQDEGYAEGDASEKEEGPGKELPPAGPKRLRTLLLKTRAMTRFKGQRPQFIVARTTALERAPTLDDQASLRRRRSRLQTPVTSRPESEYSTEDEDEPAATLSSARPPSRASSTATRSAPDRPATPDAAAQTAPEPPAYTHGQSPSYSRAARPTPRQLEKRRLVDPPPPDAAGSSDPPALADDDDDALEEERRGASGHVATDDKAVLEARRQLASRPSVSASIEDDEATAPYIALDMDGFEAPEPDPALELAAPSMPPPAPAPEAAGFFPAPPQAVVPTFTGLSLPTDGTDATAPSAPDLDLEYGPDEASAPPEDDLAGDLERVIQSSAAVGWLPIYEPASPPRAGHAVV